MKKILEIFLAKKIIFKSLKEIKTKELGSRKKVNIYLGVDKKDYYNMITFIEKKSRILIKETEDFVELHRRLEKFTDTKILKKHILIKAPLCSKAKLHLEGLGWSIFMLG